MDQKATEDAGYDKGKKIGLEEGKRTGIEMVAKEMLKKRIRHRNDMWYYQTNKRRIEKL